MLLWLVLEREMTNQKLKVADEPDGADGLRDLKKSYTAGYVAKNNL